MAASVKVEHEAGDVCALCNSAERDLFLPEEYDAGAPRTLPPMKTILLHLSHNKPLPEGRICGNCAQRAVDAYEFSTQISSNTAQPLSEKIRQLRKRLHELTQRIDVFIVVGAGSEGGYQEEDIIMVQKDKLAAAVAADEQRPTKWLMDEYQCSICPKSFQSMETLTEHMSSHSPAQTHTCWQCGTQLGSEGELLAHRAEHCASDITCHLCATHFQSETALVSHQECCPSVCPLCGCACISRVELAAHAREIHASGLPALCVLCFYVANTEEDRLTHSVRHRAGTHYVCGADGCLLRFKQRRSLTAHIRAAHTRTSCTVATPPHTHAHAHTTTTATTTSVGTRSTRTRTRARNNQNIQEQQVETATFPSIEPESAYLEADSPADPRDHSAEPEAEEQVEYLEMDTFDDD